MKIWFIQLFLLLAVIGIGKGFLNDVEFQTIIKERCYNRTLDHKRLVNGQHVPLGNTMETFIDILEDFERNFTHPPEKIIELFLTRFRIDGVIEEQENVFRQNLNDKGRLELIKAILKPTTKLTEFREEIFSEEKKCALYYMMSHAIVIDKESHFNPTVPPDGTSPEATEQGVVTLNNNPIHSIALGRVLLGILAGLKSEQEQSTASILKFINKLPSMPPEPHQLEGKIDPLYGVTVGDTIAAEVLRTVRTEAGKITKTRKFGPNGKWNSTNCPTKYILTKPATYATYGEIRGAGDGLILGLQVRELRKKNAKISISTLLRMYYSTRGIPLSNTYSYCRRWDNWGIYNDKAFEQIRFYSRLMNIAIGGSSLKDADLLEGANDAFSEFTNSRDDIVDSIIRQENCFNYDLDVASSCETPSDVFVVLDTRGNEEDIWKRQKDVVTSLSTGLDIRYYGGRFYIFTNSRGFGDRVLETIAFNETSSGCVGCKLDWYYAGFSQVDETYVLQSLYKMLTDYELDRSHSGGVPGKTIVYFNYAKTLKQDRNFQNAYWELKNKHRDVQIFAVGSDRSLLQRLATDYEKVILEDTAKEIVDNLKNEICESPGILQYKECNERPSVLDDYDSVFQGYVTPKRIQYWSMFPEFFLKSFHIKFQFSAVDGNIRVCFSRYKTHIHKGYCQETSSTDDVLSVYISNPCKGKNVYNCDPFHFSIEGKDTGSHEAKCLDKECKTFDQIKFTIRHEGVSCNGSTGLFSSFALIALTLFYLMKMNK